MWEFLVAYYLTIKCIEGLLWGRGQRTAGFSDVYYFIDMDISDKYIDKVIYNLDFMGIICLKLLNGKLRVYSTDISNKERNG